MKRLFDEHIIRQVTFLDGAWKFAVDKDNVGEEQNFKDGIKSSKTVIVPSVWNTDLDLLKYEGVCWYERDFYFEGNARLVFEGVMTECKVWLDGEYLGYHYGGFCQFDFIVPDLKAGVHKLVLKVDNSFNQEYLADKSVFWFNFGGITRSVSVEKLNGVAVTYAKFDYKLSDDNKSAEIFFTAELYGADKKKETEFCVTLDDKKIYSESVALDKGSLKTLVTEKITINDVKLWDVNNPYLYTVVFSTETDDLIDKIGFRSIEVKNAKLYLNGKNIEIRGVNRQEDHPEFGVSIPTAIMSRDLEIIEDMSCNAIRGTFYPNSRVFLDMLDKRGILFWSEIPLSSDAYYEKDLANEKVVNLGLQMHKEMVRYYYNHPCIIFWGMHNELRTNLNNARIICEQYYTFLKNNGGNRLVTYASDRPKEDICFEFCDVISVSQYFGWKYRTREYWPTFTEVLSQRCKELGFENKPVIVSAFGAAAAYGYHTFDDVKWTEEYQAKLLEIALQSFHDCPNIAGSFLSQFCDSVSDKNIEKVGTVDNNGILNGYREPKLAYNSVKALFHKFKEEVETNE